MSIISFNHCSLLCFVGSENLMFYATPNSNSHNFILFYLMIPSYRQYFQQHHWIIGNICFIFNCPMNHVTFFKKKMCGWLVCSFQLFYFFFSLMFKLIFLARVFLLFRLYSVFNYFINFVTGKFMSFL